MSYPQRHTRTAASRNSDWESSPDTRFIHPAPLSYNYRQTVLCGTSPLYFTPTYTRTFYSDDALTIYQLGQLALGTCQLRAPSLAGPGTADERCLRRSSDAIVRNSANFAPPFGSSPFGPYDTSVPYGR